MHAGTSHEWQTKFFGSPLCKAYEVLCAGILFPPLWKYPYPSLSQAPAHIKQPVNGIQCDLERSVSSRVWFFGVLIALRFTYCPPFHVAGADGWLLAAVQA